MNKNLAAKFKEALVSVLPITAIVLLLNFTVAPMTGGTIALFLVGALLLIVGMALFSLGADIAMMPMGERIGSQLTKTRKLGLLVVVALIMGIAITMAEPDLQVLADQVPSVPNMVLIVAVAVGVGLFLVLALLRIIFQKKLAVILILLYAAVFGLAIFTSEDFLAVAFDSGGVTTGPITVPFILSLGVGVAAVRGGRNAQEDSFGLVAICSVGPILVVMIMGMLFNSSGGFAADLSIPEVNDFAGLMHAFGEGFPEYFRDVGIAIAPIIAFFIIFQVIFLKLPKTQLLKMAVGMAYTYIGLVLFLTGVSVGFMPVGNYLGAQIGSLGYNWVLIPLGMVMGFFVVMAEPAVHVLNKQVEEITVGAISRKSMLLSLSIGVAVSVGLAMVRVVTGLSIWYFLVPGYAIALGLSFFVPKIFTAIAFDSGGVASGPMTATFLLPFAMGACSAVGGNMLTDAFGIVAMVAMTPLVTIQIMGLYYKIKTRNDSAQLTKGIKEAAAADEDEIIDL
ncbi:DUF1538 domain-containing protein [Christensenella intestinihominis]|uniref:DUF1538 domain-containing protein n=1 Tax=Christensenella intestinihominis TaxID=1851429 RepID=UPI000833FC19|nr:DUF1538 domain-containing protein [Christensenella intestinihominis]